MAWHRLDETIDLTSVSWDSVSTGSTNGVLPKAVAVQGDTTYYYKTSSYDRRHGFYGLEAQNELVATRVFECLGVDHTSYDLMPAIISYGGQERITWINRSRSFVQPGEERMTLDSFLEMRGYGPGEAAVQGLVEEGLWDSFSTTIVLDYLLANRDRHGANSEVLLGPDGSVRMAPPFDFGLSLTAPYALRKDVDDVDPMFDFMANNYVGSRSLADNLSLVSCSAIPGRLDSRTLDYILEDLRDIYPSDHLAKIREILQGRWSHIESIRDLERGKSETWSRNHL